MNIKILVFLAIIIIGYSCTSEPKEPSTDNETNTTEENVVQKTDATKKEMGTFDHYNAVNKLVEDWNTAINDKDFRVLEHIYADNPYLYLNQISLDECIQAKKKFLGENPKYSQKLSDIAIYFLDDYENGEPIENMIVECKKICTSGEYEATYDGLLKFKRINKEWKLAWETDVITEVNRAKKSPIVNLPDGKYIYARGYWEDTRLDEDFGHDMVPYDNGFSIEIKGTSITGGYSRYSGRMRSTSSYTIESGHMKNGILTLKKRLDKEDWDKSDSPNPLEEMNFKVLKNKNLVGLDKNNPELYGKVIFHKVKK